jgi:hypothetical protein
MPVVNEKKTLKETAEKMIKVISSAKEVKKK